MARVVLAGALLASCKAKATPTQCEAIVGHYAELVVKENYPDASPSEIAAERDREKAEARGDDAFKNCASEVQASDYDCAMKATTPAALEKCLE